MKTIILSWSGPIPGYADALPDGSYIGLIPDQLKLSSSLGTIPLPGIMVRTPRLSRNGSKICAVGDDGFPWEYAFSTGQWRKDPRPVVGEYGCIYDAGGVLTVNPGPWAVGYRYISESGQIVQCKESPGHAGSYADPSRGLYEYTEFHDCAIGQGGAGGVLVWFPDGARVLTGGGVPGLGHAAQYITVNREGDDFALTVVSLPQHLTFVIWCSLAELRAMPPYAVVTQPPPPLPPPPPPPPETPTMPVAPNRLTDLQALAAAHPEINRMADGPFAPNRGGITHLAAQTFGFPFGRKSRNAQGTDLNDDGLTYALDANGDSFEIYDILSGGDGSVQWNYAGTFSRGQNGYFARIAGTPTPSVDPEPPPSTLPPSWWSSSHPPPPSVTLPVPPVVDLTPIREQLEALTARMDRLAEVQAQIYTAVRDVHTVCARLSTNQDRAYVGALKFSGAIRLTPELPK